MGASLADYSRIQLLSFLYKVLHVRQPCYLVSLCVSAVRSMVRGVDASN
jgi:hypothetical protein